MEGYGTVLKVTSSFQLAGEIVIECDREGGHNSLLLWYQYTERTQSVPNARVANMTHAVHVIVVLEPVLQVGINMLYP